jgi:hypothetical protein
MGVVLDYVTGMLLFEMTGGTFVEGVLARVLLGDNFGGSLVWCILHRAPELDPPFVHESMPVKSGAEIVHQHGVTHVQVCSRGSLTLSTA